MSIEVFVTTAPDGSDKITLPNNITQYETLGDEETIAVRLQELLGPIFGQVRESVTVACDIQVAVSGKVTLKGTGGVNYLIFNVGGETAAETTMTITVKASVSPVAQE